MILVIGGRSKIGAANLFLQNVRERTTPSIDPDGRFYLNAGDARISMIDNRDAAAAAVAALTEPGHENQEYDVTGPEALSYADVATLISEHQRRSVTYVPTDDQATQTALLGYGLDAWLAGALISSTRTTAAPALAGTPSR